MTDRPILFSGPMVRALLAGRKTQTRRVVKLDVPVDADEVFFWSGEELRRKGWRNVSEPGLWARKNGRDGYIEFIGRCPYGVPGDRLWVKETWALHERFTDVARVVYAGSQGQSWSEMHRDVPAETAITRYAPKPFQEGFRPSIHMPRWASRLTLEITEVRVERLQEISEGDAVAEGTQEPSLVPLIGACWSERDAYAKLWEKINGPGSWDANPWAWAVTFEVEAQP